ncbi:MAG: dockerin type I repeat-containing protein [Bacteroidales bacterium]|nr:dockerin type I repeat-containing protein [Bacteroidales bacterium]
MSSLFLRMNTDSENSVAKSLRYWFDDGQTASVVEIVGGEQLLDASMLTEGLHTVHYQIADSKGLLCAPTSAVFMKFSTDNTSEPAKSIRYWLDDDALTEKVTDVANGTQTLDVSDLTPGLHTLNYQLIDSRGQETPPVTRFFVKNIEKKLADGQNRVTKYQYWLNRNTQALQTMDIEGAANPYTLISLLPVQEEPIQSSQFHFEISDDKPIIYAKNTFHILFWDAQGYFSDGNKTFIDYKVKQEVTDPERLEPGVHTTTAKPAENVIKWYCLDAEQGDSLQFKLDRAATIQLFAPSGEEIYNASGYDVVNWGGCHVWENGTFYLALHDVATQQWGDIGLDYNHIDKHAILRQDVSVVGNGGCSTITFEGNGFRDLYGVDLFTNKGDTLSCIHINHCNDAKVEVTFDFSGIELVDNSPLTGNSQNQSTHENTIYVNDSIIVNYHALFHFVDEDRVLHDNITVEEAKDIKLTTWVTYPSTFLRGTSTTYTIKITNKGNMTAYAVPIYAFIRTTDADDIQNIKFDGLELESLFDGIDTDGMSSDEINQLKNICDSIGDSHHFLRIKAENEDHPDGDSIFVFSNYFLVDLKPNSTKILTLNISTRQYGVEAYITVPNEWMALNYQEENNPQFAFAKPRRSFKDWWCCYREGIECFADLMVTAADIGSLVMGVVSVVQPELAPIAGTVAWADCALSIGNTGLKAAGEFACGSNEEQLKERLLNSAKAAGKSAIGATLSCISGKFTQVSNKLQAAGDVTKVKKGKILLNISDKLSDIVVGLDIPGLSCVKTFIKPKPNCPPNPGGGGGTSNPVTSMDPNDIFGYTAESGCHAVKDGQTDVYYRIEFENEPEVATAAAHDIIVTDTLDATRFDLSTYEPTRVRIGKKSSELSGDKNFVTTIDMRPEINAIAQVEGTYDQTTGIAKWYITSLDPMTMEPTDNPMEGVLPVNTNGNGIGEVSFNISLKHNLEQGTEIDNRAAIVFDQNDVIMTPIWTNVIDRTAPSSTISAVQQTSDSTAIVSIEATDELSGVWRYDVYAKYGEGTVWIKVAENVPADVAATVTIYEGIEQGFYVVATDSAGNMEQKEPEREASLLYLLGDANGDGYIDVGDITAIVGHIQENAPDGFVEIAADVNKDGDIDVGDITALVNLIKEQGNVSVPVQRVERKKLPIVATAPFNRNKFLSL